MKIYCISDNQEIQTGLKLSGCNGAVLQNETDINNKIDEIIDNKEIGVLVITQNIYKMSKEKIDKIMETKNVPLITII